MRAERFPPATAAPGRGKIFFFANVSHELRTPLMMIIAAIESVQEQNLGDLKIGQQVQVGQRNGLRLLRLVDDLLELSKLESGTSSCATAPSTSAHLSASSSCRHGPWPSAKASA